MRRPLFSFLLWTGPRPNNELTDREIWQQERWERRCYALQQSIVIAICLEPFYCQARSREQRWNFLTREETQVRAIQQPRFCIAPGPSHEKIEKKDEVAHIRDARHHAPIKRE